MQEAGVCLRMRIPLRRWDKPELHKKTQLDGWVTMVLLLSVRINDAGPVSIIPLVLEEEVLVGRIVRPDLIHSLVRFFAVFQFLKILNNLRRRARTQRVVNQFILGGWPRGVVEIRREFHRPDQHSPRCFAHQYRHPGAVAARSRSWCLGQHRAVLGSLNVVEEVV